MAVANEIRVGLLVVVAGGLLLMMTLWILGQASFDQSQSVEVLMPHAGGVRSGDPVRIAGVPAGRVESLALDPAGELPVRLTVSLPDEVVLRSGANAALASDSLLGGTFLEIDPGPAGAPPLPTPAAITGRSRASFDSALASLGGVGDTADQTLRQLGEVMVSLEASLIPMLDSVTQLLNEGYFESAARLIERTDRTLAELGPRIETLLEHTDVLVVQLTDTTEELPDLAAELTGLAAQLEAVLGPDGSNVTLVLDSARGTLDSLRADRGELGAMVADLRTTASNLRALSESLRDRPSTLLGLGEPPDRRPGEPRGQR